MIKNIEQFVFRLAATLVVYGVFLSVATAQKVAADQTKLRKCAERKVLNVVGESLTSAGDVFYFATDNGFIHAVEDDLKSELWRTEIGGVVDSNIVAGGDRVFLITKSSSGGSELRAISSGTGVPEAPISIPTGEKYRLTLFNDELVIANDSLGILSVYRLGTNKIIWSSSPLGTLTSKPTASDIGIAFGTEDGRVYLLNRSNGKAILAKKIDAVPTVVAMYQGTLIVGDNRGNLASLSPTDGSVVWRFKAGAAVTSVIDSAKNLFVASLDNFVYLLSSYNGDIVWKRRLPGRVIGNSMRIDENFGVQTTSTDAFFLIEKRKGRVVHKIEPGLLRNIVAVGSNHTGSILLIEQADISIYHLKDCLF